MISAVSGIDAEVATCTCNATRDSSMHATVMEAGCDMQVQGKAAHDTSILTHAIRLHGPFAGNASAVAAMTQLMA